VDGDVQINAWEMDSRGRRAPSGTETVEEDIDDAVDGNG